MFNPSEHLLNIGTANKPRMYLETKYRLVWLREQYPEAQIETEIVHLDLEKEVSAEVFEWDEQLRKSVKVTKHGQGIVIMRATVKLPNGAIGTGTKMQNGAEFSEWLEKCETGAIGRALAGLGYGTAATDEMSEGEGRVVDAPVDRKPSYDPDKPCTDQQLATVRKLRTLLSMEQADLDGLTFGDVAALIAELNKRLQEQKKQAS